jgi:uncharacterized OB-fold protein
MQITRCPGGHVRQTTEGTLLVAVRVGDGELRFPPPEFVHGGAATSEVLIGPIGSLYTFTTVYPGKDVPAYSLAMVDFAPGLRVFGRLLHDAQHPAALDAPVRIVPATLPDGSADYAFEPLPGVRA